MFIRLLTSIINACNHQNILNILNNQQCSSQPTLINLHSNKYSQELCYDPFADVPKVAIL